MQCVGANASPRVIPGAAVARGTRFFCSVANENWSLASLEMTKFILCRTQLKCCGSLEANDHFARPGRQIELCAARLIQFQGRRNIQVSEGDFPRPRSRVPIIPGGVKVAALDHVLGDFFCAAIAKNDKRGRKFGDRRCLLGGLGDSRMRIRNRRGVAASGWRDCHLASRWHAHPLAVTNLEQKRLDRDRGRRRRLDRLRSYVLSRRGRCVLRRWTVGRVIIFIIGKKIRRIPISIISVTIVVTAPEGPAQCFPLTGPASASHSSRATTTAAPCAGAAASLGRHARR